MLRWLLAIWRRLPSPLQQTYLRGRYTRFAAGVSALVRDGEGRVLLVHRTYNPRHPWGLPGGWLEPGEDLDAALARELFEETGLRGRAGAPAAVLRWSWQISVLIVAEIPDGNSIAAFCPSAEVDAVAWFSPRDLPDLAPVHRALLVGAGVLSSPHAPSEHRSR